MTDVKVSFYLKRNEAKADGTAPVLGRIRIGKSMVQFSAKVSVTVEYVFDENKNRAEYLFGIGNQVSICVSPGRSGRGEIYARLPIPFMAC